MNDEISVEFTNRHKFIPLTTIRMVKYEILWENMDVKVRDIKIIV